MTSLPHWLYGRAAAEERRASLILLPATHEQHLVPHGTAARVEVEIELVRGSTQLKALFQSPRLLSLSAAPSE